MGAVLPSSSPRRPGLPRWPRRLAFAYGVLGTSAALLALPLLGASTAYGSELVGLGVVAALALTALLAWPILLAAVFGLADARPRVRGAGQPVALVAVALGFVGFIVGMGLLPAEFPARVDSWFCEWEWQCLLYGGFASVPTVFAPVVVSHAALALVAAEQLSDRRARHRLALGAGLLIAVTFAALVVQITGAFHDWAWGVVCLTAPGYALASAGAWRGSGRWPTASP